MRVIFMGTPEFAVTILDKLVQEGINIVAVITAPDRPAGRGQKLKCSAVKEYALEKGIDILQPLKLKDESFIETLKSYQADLQVVVAFRMLPEIVWNMPPKGTINLHASLLPQYRGAAPINWAIINGEKETGVTTFFIEKEIDTGAVIEQETIPIENNDTAGSLHDKLMHLGAKLTHQSVLKIEQGKAKRTLQTEMIADESLLKPAPKIFKPYCEIDFSDSDENIVNKIKGLSPYPTAWFKIINKETEEVKSCKVFFATAVQKDNLSEGMFLIEDKQLFLGTKNGAIQISELQLEGKKRMPIESLLNGFDFSDWKIKTD